MSSILIAGQTPPAEALVDAAATRKTPAEACEYALVTALMLLRNAKPEDRSSKDRSYAVTITDLEKSLAYFKTFVVDVEEPDATQNPT